MHSFAEYVGILMHETGHVAVSDQHHNIITRAKMRSPFKDILELAHEGKIDSRRLSPNMAGALVNDASM